MGLDGGFLKFTRLEPRHEPVEERIKHFNEFIAIYSDTEGREQASRCMDCGIPFCQHQCPLHNTMPDTQQYVSDGDWESAWRVLDSTNSFPEITGRICPAPCEEGCTLGLHRDAVSIKAIEKKIAEVAFSRGYVTPQPAAASTGCSVAVVGSGPAGLAAAQQLARMGHAVTVYEKMDKPGGLCRCHNDRIGNKGIFRVAGFVTIRPIHQHFPPDIFLISQKSLSACTVSCFSTY